MSMVHVRITLTADENTAVRLEALRRRISVDDVIRECIAPLLKTSGPGNPFGPVIGIGRSRDDEPTDRSVRHNTYLHGGELDEADASVESGGDNPFESMLGIIVGEPGDPDDVSVNHDYYLHGGSRDA